MPNSLEIFLLFIRKEPQKQSGMSCHRPTPLWSIFAQSSESVSGSPSMMATNALSRLSPSTLTCYCRSLPHIALHFGRSPVEVDQEELQQYLHDLVRQDRFSESYFKFSVYAYCTLGMDSRRRKLSAIPHKNLLPAVLSKDECRHLFVAPSLLKLRIPITFMYSSGLRMKESGSPELKAIDATGP